MNVLSMGFKRKKSKKLPPSYMISFCSALVAVFNWLDCCDWQISSKSFAVTFVSEFHNVVFFVVSPYKLKIIFYFKGGGGLDKI